MKKLIIWFLTITSIINFSCYAYYEIPKEDLEANYSEKIDRIRLKNKTEIVLGNQDSVFINQSDSTLVLKKDSLINVICLKDIDKIITAEFSLSKTIFSIIGLTLVAFIVFIMYMDNYYSPGG